MRANSAAIAVVAVLAFLPCSDAAAQEQWVPWAAAGWSQQGVDLAGIVENWPALEGLRGACSISMGIRPKRAGGAARELWLHVPETAFGDLPLGVLDVAVTEPLRTGPSVVRMQMRGPVAGLARAHFELPARVDLLGGKVDWRSGPVEGQVVLRDVDLDAVTAAFPVLAIGGKVDLTLDVGGSTKNLALSGRIQGDDLSWRSDAIGRVVGTVNHRDNLSKIAVEWGPKARSIANLTASVPLDISLRRGDVRWLDAKPHDMTLSARGLTPKRLRPFWRAPHGADFSVDVFAGGLGTLDDFGINVTVTGRLIDPDRPWIPVFATAHLGPRRQTAQLTLGEELLEIGVETEANLIGIRRRGKRFETAELRGSAALRLPLARVSPYLSEAVHDLSGKLIGDVAVEGTLGQPKFTGAFSTSDGGVTLVDLNLRLNQLKFAGRLEGTTLQISDLSGLAGLGRIGGSGQLELIATPPGKPPAEGLWSQWSMKGAFDGGLERFPFIHDSFPNGLVDTKFRAELEAGPGETNLELVVDGGSLFVSEAHILPEAAAIPENRGVRLIDWRGDVDASRSFLEGDGHLRARVWLAAPFKVRGETTELDFTGGVVVDRVDRDVAVEGAFEARKGGEFHLFDNEFTVLGGTLTVAGGNLDEREALAQGPAQLADPNAATAAVPLELVIDFAARGYAVDTYVLLQVRGPLRRPELILASSPALPEYQILTLLITGKVDAVDEKNGNVRKQVAKLVSKFHNPSLSRQLYDRIGLDKLGVGFGKSVAQPILTVGKQVSRQLYVETVYHHDAPPDENEKEARINYQLSPNWTVDTAFGDAGIGSFGLFWSTHWGGPPRPKPPADWGVTEER